MKNSRILVVDDEVSLLKMVKILLNKEGFDRVETAGNGSEALEHVNKKTFDLVLLDVNLPDIEGYMVCLEIRKISNVPIFFLTARNTDLDKVSGFAYGADDYITKPFNPLELVARVKAHLKRRNLKDKTLQLADFDNGHLYVNYNNATVKLKNKTISMTAQLFQLLSFFSKAPNQIFSKEQIYENVWGESSFGDDSTVIVHIRKLREKIEQDPSQPKYIITVRGLGYKFISEHHE